MQRPSFSHERELASRGYVALGVDEVGCGCLAGPVVAAAMHLPFDSRLVEIRDSKLLSPGQRERLLATFTSRGYRWAIGVASVEEIDRLNIRNATYLAMRRAVEAFLDPHEAIPWLSQNDAMRRKPHALVDAWTIPELPIPQQGIVHGDRFVKSIAAASIVAKVARDAMMVALDQQFPNYGFAMHKGYATSVHRAAIATYGISESHRRSFCGTTSLREEIMSIR